MVKVIYVEAGGAVHEVDARAGVSVMQTAISKAIPGIDADCGGACSCATCHVRIGEAWVDRVGPPGATEGSMLEFAVDPGPTSRLSCQIVLTPSLDGLIVHLPETQK